MYSIGNEIIEAGTPHGARLFSVALMDPVCPPSTLFAAYNPYGGPRQIRVYEFNEHEGGAAPMSWRSN